MNLVFFSHITQDDNEKTLFRVSRVLAAFQAMNRSMTVEVANVFLMVCLDEGQRLTDYTKKTGLSQSTLSRYLLDLSTYRRDLSEGAEDDGRKEAYGLVRSEVDPMELRAKRYFLTPRGRALRDRVLAIIDGTEPRGPTKSVVALAAAARTSLV
jgi:hypothetical protein